MFQKIRSNWKWIKSATLENLLLQENNQLQVSNRTNGDSKSARIFPQKSLAINAVTASNIEHNWPLKSIKALALD